MAPEQSSLPERIESSYRKLSTVASELNFVSDELGKYVSEMDAALKKLNLGIEAWVFIRGQDTEEAFWSEHLGYRKILGKWGIALRTLSGVHGCEDDADVEVWPFNDAPRSLRLSAIGKIPELLEMLSAEGAKVAKEIVAKLEEAKQVAAVVTKAAEEPVKKIVARGGAPATWVPQQSPPKTWGQEPKK